MLRQFLVVEDPLKARLEWLAVELKRVEAGAKVGAPKGEHSQPRMINFSSFGVKRLNSRLGLYI